MQKRWFSYSQNLSLNNFKPLQFSFRKPLSVSMAKLIGDYLTIGICNLLDHEMELNHKDLNAKENDLATIKKKEKTRRRVNKEKEKCGNSW